MLRVVVGSRAPTGFVRADYADEAPIVHSTVLASGVENYASHVATERIRLSSHDRIADMIREDIITGRLKSGERLPEEVIAKKHRVSRVPVREALRRLETEGFVTVVKYSGARVSSRSWQDSLELMQVRRGLEVLAARMAADQRGGTEAAALTNVVERGQSANAKRDIGELPDLIMEFHRLVAIASGNRQLQDLLTQLLRRISWGFELDLEVPERTQTAWFEHSVIALAIVNGSSTQAGFLMDEHVLKDEILYEQKRMGR